jgi:hypothetical protein
MKRRAPAWTRLADEQLLDLRLCDLRLRLRGTPVERRIARLYRELAARGIAFRPHAWLAEEWFSPDGVPGFAVPFYLAHPRLTRLERKMTGAVEGSNANWQMRILRHEAGHAIDSAYRLRRRARWRALFGHASRRYASQYRARPASHHHVQHLGEWYAQAHPTEDFAETFAVWLTPKSGWRKDYEGWPALHKLKAVDELVASVRARPAPVRNRTRIEPLEQDTRTLAQHYRRKLAQNRQIRRGLADELLRRAITDERPRRQSVKAATLLRAQARPLTNSVARTLAIDSYSVEQVLRMLIERSEHLRLYVRGNQRDARRYSRWMLERLTGLYSQGETPHLSL